MAHNVVAALDLAATALAAGEPVPDRSGRAHGAALHPRIGLYADGRRRLADGGAAQSRPDPAGPRAVRTGMNCPRRI